MKKAIFASLLAIFVATLSFSSCTKKNNFTEKDLYGAWKMAIEGDNDYSVLEFKENGEMTWEDFHEGKSARKDHGKYQIVDGNRLVGDFFPDDDEGSMTIKSCSSSKLVLHYDMKAGHSIDYNLDKVSK